MEESKEKVMEVSTEKVMEVSTEEIVEVSTEEVVEVSKEKVMDESVVADKSESREVIFKRPLALPTYPVPKKKRKVLSEDKFADALEKIIQRECFPELEKLKAQNAYLDAVANNDLQMMRELHTKYGSSGRTPSLRDAKETPTTFETPSSIIFSSKRKEGIEAITPILPQAQGEPEPTANDDAKSVTSETSSVCSKTGRRPHDMALNEFLNTYTSEDNHSFQEIIDEGIRKHKIKYAWLFQQEVEHHKKLKEVLQLPSASEQQSLDFQRPNQVETWTYKNKNAVMYIPDGAPYTGTEVADMIKNKNEVEFKNTRFTAAPYKPEIEKDKEPSTPSGKTLNLIRGITEGKIGVDGREVNLKTPSVNGYKYVRTPSPTAGVAETPFLTWGEIEGTPFRLDASDTPLPSSVGTPYRMIATSQRERLALELAEKVSQRHRDKKQKTIEVAKSYLTTPSPRPKTSVERMNLMSPAAQRFAKNLLKRSDTGTPRTPR